MDNSIVIPKLNPRVKTVEVGIDELRSVKMYPLSAACQLSIPGLIGGFFEAVATIGKGETPQEDMSTFSYFDILSGTLRNNISEVLTFVFKENDRVTLDVLDNVQLMEIVENIMEVNYGEDLRKKFQVVKENLKTVFPLTNLSPKLSETLATN